MEVRNADAPTLPDIVDARNTPRVVRALWALAEACASQGLQAGALHARVHVQRRQSDWRRGGLGGRCSGLPA